MPDDSDKLLLRAFDDEVRMTPARRRALLTIGLGEFVDGYDLIVISGALLQLQPQFHLKPGDVGWLSAAAFFGSADPVMTERVDAVKGRLLALAEYLESACELDAEWVNEIHRLLTDGCASPLLNDEPHISELYAAIYYLEAHAPAIRPVITSARTGLAVGHGAADLRHRLDRTRGRVAAVAKRSARTSMTPSASPLLKGSTARESGYRSGRAATDLGGSISHRRTLRSGLVIAAVDAVACVLCAVGAAATTVSAFPLPGTRYNRPATQIAFRGVSRGALGMVSVVGSRSGVHKGRIEVDSDGRGASFLPYRPFVAGETVTVRTRLDVVGARHGRFSFAIGNVLPLIRCAPLSAIPRPTPRDVMHFRSRPDLRPASVTFTENMAPASNGDIFLAPQNGPLQTGPMILNPLGQLVWFMPFPVSGNVFANDFRVQDLHGRPVLTWWQGCRNNGLGRGQGIIVNQAYRRIAAVSAANGLAVDSHGLLVTPQGDAYVIANSPVHLPGTQGATIDWVVQEIDIKTGLVLFDWHALDHVPLSAAYRSTALFSGLFDPYHLNSVSLTGAGNLLVSMRNTCAAYEIGRRTGRVLWTLGGKHSSFRMGPGTRTWEQHDVVAQPDGTVTIFDNGGGLPFVHPQSRGIHERLDARTMTATLLREYDHRPLLSSVVEGGMQLLPNGDAFIGWGAEPFFSEYNAFGQQILDAHFNAAVASYRAYRFSWSAQPLTPPALAVVPNANGTRGLYASWNGATDVSAWRVLAGTTSTGLRPIASVPDTGFETAIRIQTNPPYVAVQALGINGQILSTSVAVATGGYGVVDGRAPAAHSRRFGPREP